MIGNYDEQWELKDAVGILERMWSTIKTLSSKATWVLENRRARKRQLCYEKWVFQVCPEYDSNIICIIIMNRR